MITVSRAKESRKRDEKRCRILLTIGDKKFHLDLEETAKLSRDIDDVLKAVTMELADIRMDLERRLKKIDEAFVVPRASKSLKGRKK